MEATTSPAKPLKPKPQFYALCFAALQQIARDLGYNLIMHGSFNRDMDLVAIPWIDNPAAEMQLIQAFDKYLTGKADERPDYYLFSILPGGRGSYVINLNRGGRFNGYVDEQYYLDISITPFPNPVH